MSDTGSSRPTALERAFQLAEQRISVPVIREILRGEGYNHGYITPSVARQLYERAFGKRKGPTQSKRHKPCAKADGADSAGTR